MRPTLQYRTLEKVPVRRPVDRISFIADRCRGKRVLDIGCLDETALFKKDTMHWLHGRITQVAESAVGVDNSTRIPAEGLAVATNSRIYRGDATDGAFLAKIGEESEVVVAGEFIEHIENPLRFLTTLRAALPGRELIVSTPNGPCLSNTLLGLIGREAQHHDHLHVFSYKTLNTLLMRAGFEDWEIIPYRFFATEMKLTSPAPFRPALGLIEWGIRAAEYLFPLLSFGYIVRTRL
jgi:SAM-dependent methyltransferase